MRGDHFQAAVRLEQLGQHREARDAYRRASGKNPKNPAILAGIGRCSVAMHEHAEARSAFERVLRIDERDTDSMTRLAHSCMMLGDIEAARAHARRVLEIDERSVDALRVLADTYRTIGEIDRAYALIAPMVQASDADPRLHIDLARLASVLGRVDEAVRLLTEIDHAGLPSLLRSSLHYELGSAYDKLGRYDDAWASFELANALSPDSHDLASFGVHVDALIEVWTPERVSAMTRAGYRTDLPVYIIGMPRSGSSLLEQILSGNKAVAAGGERDDIPVASRQLLYPEGVLHADTDAMTRRIDGIRPASLDRIAKQIEKKLQKTDADAQRVTDKNLSNYLYIPLILMLFPEVSIIHTRRHPLDTCLSCYFQNFGTGMEFTNNLISLGASYRHYARLMRHWMRVFPGRIVELDYEEVIADPEAEARRVVNEVGVPWDGECLRFYERKNPVVTRSDAQVRRPIYRSSVRRWTNYEKYLKPLRKVLEDMLSEAH